MIESPLTSNLSLSPRRSPRKRADPTCTSPRPPQDVPRRSPRKRAAVEVKSPCKRPRRSAIKIPTITKKKSKMKCCMKPECGPCAICKEEFSKNTWFHLQTALKTTLNDKIKDETGISDTDCFCGKCRARYDWLLLKGENLETVTRKKDRPFCFLSTFDLCNEQSCKEKQSVSTICFQNCFDINT